MKNITAIAFAFLLALGLVGCSFMPGSNKGTRVLEDYAVAPDTGVASGNSSSGGADETYLEPIPWNTEEYAPLTEHGFVRVASNPFSTFSADVDTASYCVLRRMIHDNTPLEEIPRGAVRTEEMLNYFDYDYAGPTDGTPFGVTAQVGDCPWNPDTKLLVMGLQTEDLPYSQTQGNNLVFLIDTSASMDNADKIGLLKSSFTYLVKNLNPEDTVSVVTYAETVNVVLDGTPAKNKNKILAVIDDLEPDGGTNGQEGLERAYDIASAHFIEGGNNRIIIATDGDFNIGESSMSYLKDFVTKQKESGTYLSVLGFGRGNYKDTKLETLADCGNGNYSYIDCEQEGEKVFGEDLCATMYTVAADVKLQVEFNPAYVKGYRQIGYENRELQTDDFNDDSVDAGEVGSGHSVTVAYELVMNDSAMELFADPGKYGNTNAMGVENGEWLTMSVHYKDPASLNYYEGNTSAEVAQTLEYPVTDEDYSSAPSEDWRFAAAVCEWGMVLNGSENIGTGSREHLLSVLSDLSSTDPLRVEFASLVSEVS